MRSSSRLMHRVSLAVTLLLPAVAVGAHPTASDSVHTSAEAHHAASTAVALTALPPGGTFRDDDGNIFEGLIEAIAAEGITKGCNPPANDRFCPQDEVTRGEMAVFLTRARPFPNGPESFRDDDGRFYERAANRISAAGVTNGCNPPSNDMYCGDRPITRGEMAALLVRAFDLTDDGGGDLFVDDDHSQFESAIDRLGTARITVGCNPPANDRFCPDDRVTRGQMAAFIARALGLKPIIPPPRTSDLPPGEVVSGTITGRACPKGCLVLDEAELKGDIDLQGDIMVFGGILVARPGVNLDGNGNQIMFMNRGKADFQGTPKPAWSGDGSNAILNRDIHFRNLQRIMFHQGAGTSTLKHFRISNSGTPALGDYPLHFHLNGNSTRGTIVEGVVVVNGQHHAFVPHGSHGISFKDTIAWNTKGDAYWWDEPGTNEECDFQKFCTLDNSNDITFAHALAHGVTNAPDDDRGFRLAGFRLGAGSNNTIRDSAAVNVNPTHVKDCAGFHWPQDANQNEGGNVWKFENNFSKSASGCHAAFVWQNDQNHHVVVGLRGGGIDHGAYTNNYDYQDVDVAYVEIHAVDWSMTDSKVGDVVAKDHVFGGTVTFTRVEFDSFTIDDGPGKPATYRLNQTNLGCSDIKVKSMHGGSRVVINGKRCSL